VLQLMIHQVLLAAMALPSLYHILIHKGCLGLCLPMSLHVASVLILSSVKFLAELGYRTDNKEYAIGAIMEDGTRYLNQEVINHLQISPEYLEQEKLHQIAEIRRRTSVFHGGAQT